MPLTDDELLHRFDRATLSGEEFNHLAHVRVAWLILQREPLDEAVQHICSGIRSVAMQLGAPEKFNWTMSEAITRIMADASVVATSWDTFCERHPEIIGHLPELLARHYSPARLHSREAKLHFVPPDRLPLPLCRTPVR